MRRAAFTLVELMVIIAIIIALLAILLPSMSRAIAVSESAVCASNTRQWAQVSNAYLFDSRGAYWIDYGHDPEGTWMKVLKNYYADKGDFRLCPTASKLSPGYAGGVDRAWGPNLAPHGFRPEDYGSYGVNHWINPPGPTLNGGLGWRYKPEYQFRTLSNVSRPGTTPIFADCIWYGGNPFDLDSGQPMGWVPTTPNWYDTAYSWDNDMARFCLPRHLSAINMSFVDGHAQRLDLPELWNVDWHKQFIRRADVKIGWLP